jgi:hypothetical protein
VPEPFVPMCAMPHAEIVKELAIASAQVIGAEEDLVDPP